MGLPVARMTDIGIGTDNCHSTPKTGTGSIIEGSPNVVANGLPVARLMDTVLFGDGHSGIIIQGSASVFANGLPVARMTDYFIGCFSGTLIGGSGNAFAGG